MRITHVVITRPEPQASELAGLCRRAGFEPILTPALGFEPMPDPSPWPPPPVDPGVRRLAVFTSPRAVTYGLPSMGADGLRGWELAAIGEATASVLEAAGLEVTVRPADGFRSEDLLRDPTFARQAGEAVIFAAPGGRRALHDGLVERGWSAQVREVYRRVPRAPTPEAAQALIAARAPVSTWTSAAALDALAQGLPDAAWRRLLASPLLVISNRIGRHAAALGAAWVGPLPGPSNIDIVTGLHELALH